MRALTSFALIALSSAISLFLLEVAFRGYLYLDDPDQFRSKVEIGDIGVYQQSLWEFDKDHGYRYPPNRIVELTSIKNGKVASCNILEQINENGNVGPSGFRHDVPDHTIAVFGDSWTAFFQNGKTWPVFLQDALERRTGKKINVINYGRDGYSILQMFDLAVDKLDSPKPDLVLFAFITDDIDRARFWRTQVRIKGQDRVLTTTVPSATPPLSKSTDTVLVHAAATREWCLRTMGKRDAVVEDIENKHRAILEHAHSNENNVPDILTIRNTFIFNRIVHSDATYFAKRVYRPSSNPRLAERSYEKFPRFVSNLAQVERSGIEWRLLHLAFYPEVKAQTEYLLTPQRSELLKSLTDLAGHEPLRTLDYIDLPVENPERMNVTETNFHPSLWGMELYGKAVAEMIIRNGLLETR